MACRQAVDKSLSTPIMAKLGDAYMQHPAVS